MCKNEGLQVSWIQEDLGMRLLNLPTQINPWNGLMRTLFRQEVWNSTIYNMPGGILSSFSSGGVASLDLGRWLLTLTVGSVCSPARSQWPGPSEWPVQFQLATSVVARHPKNERDGHKVTLYINPLNKCSQVTSGSCTFRCWLASLNTLKRQHVIITELFTVNMWSQKNVYICKQTITTIIVYCKHTITMWTLPFLFGPKKNTVLNRRNVFA